MIMHSTFGAATNGNTENTTQHNDTASDRLLKKPLVVVRRRLVSVRRITAPKPAH